MSKALDENAVIARFAKAVEDYGKLVQILESNDTSHDVYMSPPKTRRVYQEGNIITLTFGILINKDISWDVFRSQRIVVDSKTFRVTEIEEIRSGEQIAAYKLFVAK